MTVKGLLLFVQPSAGPCWSESKVALWESDTTGNLLAEKCRCHPQYDPPSSQDLAVAF